MSGGMGLALPVSALRCHRPVEFAALPEPQATGRYIWREKIITTHGILTPAAFENAIKVHAALLVARNAMIHLPAIARELRMGLKPELFDRINNEITYLTNIQPSGEYVTEMMWFAGGVLGAMVSARLSGS